MHFNGDQQITVFVNFWLGSFRPPHPFVPWFGVFFAVLYHMEQDRKNF